MVCSLWWGDCLTVPIMMHGWGGVNTLTAISLRYHDGAPTGGTLSSRQRLGCTA